MFLLPFLLKLVAEVSFSLMWGGGGLLEGSDPEPLLTFLVIMKAALLFSYKHGVKDKDK